MRFTRRTYRIALRRANKLEYTLFSEHYGCFRGPDPWRKQVRHGIALDRRKRRELGRGKQS